MTPGATRSVLVIEDEEPIATAVADRLRSEGFDVDIADDGLRGVELCRSRAPDLVVLDLMLPSIDGLEVCRRIRRDTEEMPILMLTARDTETDTVVGLEVGADDYMTKPFSPRELVARVHALLRRSERSATSAVTRLGDVEIDETNRLVTKDGEPVHLTPTEFDLLSHLSKRPGVYSRERLLHEVWGYRDGGGTRTVDSHIRGIRRKLGDHVIRTVHGVGYALGEPA